MDTRRGPDLLTQAVDQVGEVAAEVGTRVGQGLGAPLGQELRESALLLGLALVVLGLVGLLALGTQLLA